MRALLVKMSSLGDVIHALPAVTDASTQGIVFDWVVEESFADIPALHPGVARVIPISWRRWRKSLWHSKDEMAEFYRALRELDYDVVLDSQGLLKSAIVAVMAKGKRHGFSHTVAREPWAAFAYRKAHRISRGQHAIDRQRQLFAAAFNYTIPTLETSGLEGASPRDSIKVVLLHGTTWQTKHWPIEMWCELARLVKADGYEPVLTWGNALEQTRAQQISAASGALVQDRVPLAQLTEILGSAAMVVGVDSGLCHLSAALGTPTLGLYGPTDGMLTGCRGIRADVLQSQLSCAPCLNASCKRYRGEPLTWQESTVEPACFAELTPERVWQSAHAMMSSS